MDTIAIANKIRESLIALSDEKTKAVSAHFFKEAVNVYGVKSTEVKRVAKESFKSCIGITKEQAFEICDSLWQSGVMEESFIACEWSCRFNKEYLPDDFARFEKWITNYVSNWASCDTLCNHTVGDFVMLYPEYIAKLKEFTKSENRWVRRAAAVTLIIPARKGLFLADILEIATTLLADSDDLVQKGYGWMLKAASEAHRDEIYHFVLKHRATMPRTALRYAIEKMPPEYRKEAMIKK